ncbi:peroxiredoxin [Ascoidea rubescens DSM 1968]|uniref:Putative peroxiredoxin n=1 Tax=Ascoidea rubescens DSM 1968 TaxID=1344418 RepID=A0A1D2VHV3_9ASCO|nr:putative peroxiredoxin [Ascoidea rubescens DSM 1968]ODV61192.1 putative peroxiredoxin [Ascoidea rubescens DSM 1968]
MATNKPSDSTLRLGSIAPNFESDSSNGKINFYEYVGDSWCILFSHPDDFTPVCTTELGAFAKLEPEFTKRNVKLIGLSVNDTKMHKAWIEDINEITGSFLSFPIVSDPKREISHKYDMIDFQDSTNVDDKGLQLTIRSVFIIDPKKTIRLIMTYPASTGRNTAEVLRCVDSLQACDNYKIATPINWIPGDDVIVHNSLNNDEAKKLFPKFRAIKPYLRLTPLDIQELNKNHKL